MFTPAPEQGVVLPVYAYGAGKLRDPVFTCPVSAIPDMVWALIELWMQCRAMKALPLAGGVLDQPYAVRRAWPVLEAAIAPLEREQHAAAQTAGMTTMLASVGLIRSVGRR